MTSRAQYVFDQTRTSIVIVCRLCGWRTIATMKSEAVNAAHSHHLRTHPNGPNGYKQLKWHMGREAS